MGLKSNKSMYEPILWEGITRLEYGQILKDIEKPFWVKKIAKEGDWAVEKGMVKVDEEHETIPIPSTPIEAWQTVINLDAKKYFASLQFNFLDLGLKFSSAKAVSEEIKKVESFIEEAEKYSDRLAYDKHNARYGQYKKDFKLLEYVRISEGYYEKNNCFEGGGNGMTALIYAECFLWLPFLKDLMKGIEQKDHEKNDPLNLIEPPDLSALDALLVYFKEDKKEIAKNKIFPFFKEKFKNAKGMDLAIFWLGLYRAGYVGNPQHEEKKNLHKVISDFLRGKNGTYAGFNEQLNKQDKENNRKIGELKKVFEMMSKEYKDTEE